MNYQISNGVLTVSAESLGAQLAQIRGKDGAEYLWSGDPAYWKNRAPILFPYVARMTRGCYSYQGKTYAMPSHGFAPRTEFECKQVSETEMHFVLRDTPETREIYPFSFQFTVSYRLEENRLVQTFTVENTGNDVMYFGLGAHPGFRVPLEDSLAFEDYRLVFPENIQPIRLGFSEDCFLNGDDTPFALEDNALPLSHDLFDQDAIVLKDAGDWIRLESTNGQRSVTVEFSGLPYLGIWHRPRTDAPYVCLEPWCSLPSRKGVVEDLATQPSILRLAAEQIFERKIVFTFD